ncbi:hypothetical protein T06_9226 [Trichinella sp. T6]|nr:hypothetical protein T06_9226 [Trichinella sp. T6]
MDRVIVKASIKFSPQTECIKFKEWSKENVKTRTARSRTRESNSIRDIRNAPLPGADCGPEIVVLERKCADGWNKKRRRRLRHLFCLIE